MSLLTQIIRLLLTMIPGERGFKMAELQAPYDTGPAALPLDAPLPDAHDLHLPEE